MKFFFLMNAEVKEDYKGKRGDEKRKKNLRLKNPMIEEEDGRKRRLSWDTEKKRQIERRGRQQERLRERRTKRRNIMSK